MSERDPSLVDARLKAALQHAPDAQVQPPSDVDAAILRAARAQVGQTAARPSPAGALHGPVSWWDGLRAWWRLPLAAPALGALVLATVIVSMWRTEDIPSPLADREIPGATDESAKAQASTPSSAQPIDKPMPPAAPSSPPVEPEQRLDGPAAPRDQSRRTTVPKEQVRAAARAPAPAPAPAHATEPTAASTQTKPAAPATELMAEKRTSSAVTTPPTAATMGGERPAAAPLSASDSMQPSARARATADVPSATVAQASPRGEASAAARPPSLASLLSTRDTPSGSGYTLSWRSRSQPPIERVDPRAQAWGLSLHATTQGRWRVVANTSPDEPSSVRLSVHFQRTLKATVEIRSTSVRWVEASGTHWQADLSATEAEALGAAFD